MGPEELFERTATLEMGGRRVLRLPDTELLLHVCMHAALGDNPPRLLPLRDILQVALVGRVDWARFEELARRWHLRAVVRYAFITAARTLHAALPGEAKELVTYRPSSKERRLLEAYTTERRKTGGMALATLSAIPRITEKTAYVRALLMPDRRFLAARAGNGERGASYLQRWMVPAGWVQARRRNR
jgi:hypothetical protein